MALVPVRKPINVEQRQVRQGSSLLDKAGAAAGLGAAVMSQNPMAIAGAGIGAAKAFQPDQAYTQTRQSEVGVGEFQGGAMQRRSKLAQQDPLQAIQEARDALAQINVDDQTRALLEAPILKAMQQGRA